MKDLLRQLVASAPDNLSGRNTAREYLQARILQILQESGAFLDWAFLGGTALRFLYAIPRFSEDLDFSVAPSANLDQFRPRLKKIQRAFAAENYALGIKVSDRRAVHSAFVRFRGLLHDLKLSPHPSETLSIKLEVDTNPPPGAGLDTTLVRRHVTLNLLHYDRASLLAGKLHALLVRPYAKGRDLYDLVWYLSDRSWPAPNMELLNAALTQTTWQGPLLDADNWRAVIGARLKEFAWQQVLDDVRPFLEREADLNLLTRENCLKLLEG